MGVGVWTFRFRVWVLGQGADSKSSGLCFRVEDFELEVQGLGVELRVSNRGLRLEC